MRVTAFLKCVVIASIIPFSTIMVANDNVPDEEQVEVKGQRFHDEFEVEIDTFPHCVICIETSLVEAGYFPNNVFYCPNCQFYCKKM